MNRQTLRTTASDIRLSFAAASASTPAQLRLREMETKANEIMGILFHGWQWSFNALGYRKALLEFCREDECRMGQVEASALALPSYDRRYYIRKAAYALAEGALFPEAHASALSAALYGSRLLPESVLDGISVKFPNVCANTDGFFMDAAEMRQLVATVAPIRQGRTFPEVKMRVFVKGFTEFQNQCEFGNIAAYEPLSGAFYKVRIDCGKITEMRRTEYFGSINLRAETDRLHPGVAPILNSSSAILRV